MKEKEKHEKNHCFIARMAEKNNAMVKGESIQGVKFVLTLPPLPAVPAGPWLLPCGPGGGRDCPEPGDISTADL